MEIIHHVHGYDVAQVFMNAITHRNVSLGEVLMPKLKIALLYMDMLNIYMSSLVMNQRLNSWVGTSGVNTKETKKNVSILIIILYVVEHLALKRKKDY